MGLMENFAPVPPAAISRVLATFDRHQLEGFTAVAIDLLDLVDAPADPDEPDFSPRSDGLPGDSADTEPNGDEKDAAWLEFDERKRLITGHIDREDDEDDDPAGVNDEGGRNTGQVLAYGWEGRGCPISDPA